MRKITGLIRICRQLTLVAISATVFGVVLLAIVHPREPAPKFRARTLDGETLTNESLKGKVVLLQFWTTWCPVCRRDQPAVDALVHEFARKGLVVLAVDVGESRQKVKQYLHQSPRTCTIVLNVDTNLVAVFAAMSYPLYVLIDRDGNIAGTQSGSGGEDALRRLLQKAGIGAD